MKKILITSLTHNEQSIKSLLVLLQQYHVTVNGHFWIDDLSKMAWGDVKNELMTQDTGLWIIVANQSSLQSASILKGLSGLSLMIQADEKILQPNLLILLEGASTVSSDSLPLALQHAQILPLSAPGLGAKVVKLLHSSAVKFNREYRIKLHPLNELGLWIEIAPSHPLRWDGIIFGVNGAEINLQGYGSAGHLPERCTLEYPQQGLKLEVSGNEFSAWAIRNTIDSTNSYFARVDKFPDQILFLPYASDDEADAYVLSLC